MLVRAMEHKDIALLNDGFMAQGWVSRSHNLSQYYEEQQDKLRNEIELFSKKYYGNVLSLAVGLHVGYGNAQRLYVKRGYLFDGSNIWYRDAVASAYTSYCNDDLVLYMSKQL